MANSSNPASRLHALLDRVRRGDPKTRMLEVWYEEFAIKDRHEVEVARRLVLLNEVLDDIEQTITANPALNHKTYISGFPSIRSVFSPLVLQDVRQAVAGGHLSNEVLARLEFCSEALQAEWSEESLEQDLIQELAGEVNGLIEKVAASDLPLPLRKVLLESLEGSRLAISMYRIHGAKGLRKNLQSLFGIILTENEALKGQETKNKEILDRLGQWIEKIDSLSARALKLHKTLRQPIRSFLSWVGSSKDRQEIDSKTDGSTDSVEA